MYVTLEQARDAGATGTDDELTASIAHARRLVDLFTRQWWEPTAATVVARSGVDGYVPLPYPPVTVDSVTVVDSGVALPTTGWTLLEGTRGLLLRTWGSDVLVVGAEPWRGGWANLAGRGARVRVTGTFGLPEPHPSVVAATARLAAWLSSGGDAVAPGDVDVDEEGNHLVITAPTSRGGPVEPVTRTTGLAEVDALLAPLVTAGPVLIS